MTNRFIKFIDLWEDLCNLIKYAYDWSKQVNTETLLFPKTITLVLVPTEDDIRQPMSLYRFVGCDDWLIYS